MCINHQCVVNFKKKKKAALFHFVPVLSFVICRPVFKCLISSMDVSRRIRTRSSRGEMIKKAGTGSSL